MKFPINDSVRRWFILTADGCCYWDASVRDHWMYKAEISVEAFALDYNYYILLL